MKIENEIRKAIIAYYKNNNIKYDIQGSRDIRQLMIDYIDSLKKVIVPIKRKVFVSKELEVKSRTTEFKKWRNRFEELKGGFESGKNMNEFLSKRATDSSFRDKLLTCWGIHHLHFYPQKTRGDMLLFVIVTDNAVYMLDVLPHNKKYVFSTFNLLNILYDNWEQLIEKYKLEGIHKLEYVIKEDKEINELRNVGVSTVLMIRNDFYSLDNMITSGHSLEDAFRVNKILQDIRQHQAEFEKMELQNVILTKKRTPAFILLFREGQNDMFYSI